MAAPKIFRSTDASAPALNGNAGSLVNVLDWCLLTTGSASNLGWGNPYTGTNLRVYRAPAGVRHYLDVDDSGPDATALGRNARLRGYESMTAVATGTNAFPTTTQATTSVGIVKSTTTGTTARPWILIGDDRTFFLFVESAGTDPPNLTTHTWTSCCYFGEFLSALSGDNYRSYIGWQSATSTIVTAGTHAFGIVAATDAGNTAGINAARSYTGAGSSIWLGTLENGSIAASIPTYVGVYAVFPNPCDGGAYMNAMDLVEKGTGATGASSATAGSGFGGFRGRHRGIYQTPYTTVGYNDQDTFTGVGDFTGKTFIALKLGGMLAVETTAWAYST